ncbi:MAG: hypothetical protein WCG80_16145 [Spirochaetales bacterium]
MSPRRTKIGVVLLAVATLLAWPAFSQELPVTRVVLFTSGVGFFEHQGPVTGAATVALTFQEAQINDLLKSLVLRDPSGSVGTVTYPSQDSTERALQTFRLNLSGPGGLPSLLPQLRGLEVVLSTPTEVAGTLVGLDARPAAGAERPDTLITLSTVTGLQMVPLSSVSSVRLVDPALGRDLARALGLLATRQESSTKTLQLRFQGTGARTVSAGYISEAPVWKTSYRLDLTGAKPYLQAWAIVENTSGSDWNNVRLSLVSGRPVSFLQDLYTPLYVERPWYTPEIEAGPAPKVNVAGSALASAPMMAPAPAPPAQKSAGRSMDSYAEADYAQPEPVPLRDSGVKAASSGAQAGELFQFTLGVPFSLQRQQSALIPLAAGDVGAEKVSLYNPRTNARFAQNAVWLTNSTGVRLPAGPVTVFDGGVYAGDSLTDSLIENDKRLWTYATDLALAAQTSDGTSSETTKISVAKGVLVVRILTTWSKKYHFDNKSAQAKTVLVEHDFRSERTLVTPAQPAEKTDSLYRFRVEAPAGKATDLEVKEQQVTSETQSILGWSRDSFLSVVQRGGPTSTALKEALQKAADLRGKLDQLNLDAGALVQQKSDEESGQGRLRSNLTAVGRDSAQGQGYLKKLAESDAHIDQLATQLTDKRTAQAAAQKDLDTWLRNLTVD